MRQKILIAAPKGLWSTQKFKNWMSLPINRVTIILVLRRDKKFKNLVAYCVSMLLAKQKFDRRQ